MTSLEAELERARALSIEELADAIHSIGFECTRCGGCCTGERREAAETSGGTGPDGPTESATDTEPDGEAGGDVVEPHTATIFPDEIRRLTEREEYDFRDVARPMPYGLEDGPDGPEGETFEWALQVDDCGDCTFYAEDDGVGRCTVHEDRPLICATYPFSVALGGTSEPVGEPVDAEGIVRAHECEGLGRDIDEADARELAEALRERAIRDLEAAIAIRDGYEPADPDTGEVVVHDHEGAKRSDGTPIEE